MCLRSLVAGLSVCCCGIAWGQNPPRNAKQDVQVAASDQNEDRSAESPKSDQRAGNFSGSLVQQWLRQMDQDNDKRIALKESRGLMQKNFARVDGNSDEFLEVKELTVLSQRLKRNRGKRKPVGNESNVVPDEQVKRMVGDQLVCELNVPYREGHERWKLDLFRPAKKFDGLRPAIVFIHGGGWVRGDKRAPLFLGQAIEFSRKGYVCVTVNYRLDAKKLPCVEDVKCAVRWLRAHAKDYQIDPNKIGAYGNSAGAHLVAMLGVSASNRELEGDGPHQEFSSQIQAVAASATPTRPMSRGKTDARFAAIAPITYVTEDAPPFLLFHEVSDRLVDIGHSDDFVKALKSAGAQDVTYRRLTDGSGHSVFQKNKGKFSAEMAKFFARTLQQNGVSEGSD